MMDAVILEFVTSWNARTQRTTKQEAEIGHTDYKLMDSIVQKENKIRGGLHSLFPDYIETLKVRVHPRPMS